MIVFSSRVVISMFKIQREFLDKNGFIYQIVAGKTSDQKINGYKKLNI